MSVVYFTEEGHKYVNDQDIDYLSVSGLWKPYSKLFDAETVALKIAMKEFDQPLYNKVKKYVGYDSPQFIEKFYEMSRLPQETVESRAKTELDKWTAKAQVGTDFHKKMEDIDYEKGYSINPFTGKKSTLIHWHKGGHDNMSYPGDLKDIPDGYISEHLVKTDKFKVAGQLDKNYIETVGGVRYIDIDDYKTDKEVSLKPDFYNPKRGGFEKMFYPVDHLYNTNYWRYVLKISTYAKFLQDEGFVVRNLGITHIVVDEDLNIVSEKLYKLPYKEFEVNMVLEDFLKKEA